jgi:probable HAF family extracellular repeat protein
MQNLGTMPGGVGAAAHAISADGSVVVGTLKISEDIFNAFRWEGGAMSDLGTLAGMESSVANAVSADGTAVVGHSLSFVPSFTSRAVRWTLTGGPQNIGMLPGDIRARAFATSADGLVVVGSSTTPEGKDRAYRWASAGGMQDLGLPPGRTESVALGVDGLGTTIVGYVSAPGPPGAFLWTPALGTVELNSFLPTIGIDIAGWTNLRAYGVSNDGRTIVGLGVFNAANRGFVVRLPVLDTDGDGIPDDWEIHGVPYLDINAVEQRYILPGADPRRKNLYVEVDAMNGLSFRPEAAALVIAAFADAPLSNPDGSTGIILHIQHDDGDLPYVKSWETAPPHHCWPVGFLNFRANSFGTAAERADPGAAAMLQAKAKAFRYCIVADRATPADVGGCGEMPGDNFVIFIRGNTVLQDAAVFMHELGHNLGLKHGGCDHTNGKPNYPSIMNYVLSYKYEWNREFWKLDFSRAGNTELQNLNENSLNEMTGIGTPGGIYRNFFMPFGVNVDEGGVITRKIRYILLDGSEVDFGNVKGTGFQDGLFSASVAQDLNFVANPPPTISLPTAPSPGQFLCTHNDWAVVAQNMKTAAAIGSGAPAPSFPSDELTMEAIEWLQENFPVPPPVCYANCDRSDIAPKLNVDDFTCFINQFAAAGPLPHAEQVSQYANCDRSTVAPVLNVDDFTCFINTFALGCP